MNYLVVGLGNPGQKYIGTRHNVGFQLLDQLAAAWQASDFTQSSQTDALTAEAMVGGKKVMLVKPHTFMNKSGEAIAALANYFKIPSENILVAYDDVDLGLGTVRLAEDRGSGGHRGLQSVIDRLETKGFARLRIGISPTDEDGVVDKQTVPGKGINPFVMSQFASEERAVLERLWPDLIAGTECWIQKGSKEAMNMMN